MPVYSISAFNRNNSDQTYSINNHENYIVEYQQPKVV